ncbi:ER membrane protein complex subunit 4 [Pyrus ussuriensis x Pyrus communis]|uniref:ER membrane protein complex subunit 4 n=1 Tax=Pyrus ussuriensis x Pyrus communis TaxID=2448454 RepID=A0A5N5H3X4_9ROSA|nr:ER membrane protein complex subunit 4 [Pyrus ussuriensis x Pyrus communis]
MEKGKGVMGEGRRWAVDLTDNSTSPSTRNFPDPPGFSRASLEQDDSTVSRQKKDAESTWKAHKAWEVAQAPFKNLMMMGFMMWMAGSTVHLFSIGITFSALWYDLQFINLDLTYRRWTNNAGGLANYRPGCNGMIIWISGLLLCEKYGGISIEVFCRTN